MGSPNKNIERTEGTGSARLDVGRKDMNSTLKEIEEWYESQCDGEWEHGFGIDIRTIDNPGWSLKINLKNTPLQEIQFEKIEYNMDDEIDWMTCWKENDMFEAAGGPRKLNDMLKVFNLWVKTYEKHQERI